MNITKDKKKIVGLGIILSLTIILASIFVYTNAIKPKKYNEYMSLGNKYLIEESYKEAILAFEKAIKIDAKSTEARVGVAKGYIGINDFDSAMEILKEAQNLDKTNEKLLKEIIDILTPVDSEVAYEFLNTFVDEVGEENISEYIKNLLSESKELPSDIKVSPEPGKYINSISIKLRPDSVKIGHSYYYTVDGTNPNKESNKYRGQIIISKSTTIKLIGYNKNNESTDVVTLEYIIDKSIVDNIQSIIVEGESLIKDTIVGTEVGNISKEYKEKLQLIISESKDLLNKALVSYQEVSDIKDKLENSITEFKDNIIKPVDKSKLKAAIDNANELYNNSSEGNSIGQYKLGSKSILKNAIEKAEKIYNSLSTNQKDIDEETTNLNNAINIFKNNKVIKKPVLSTSEINRYIQKISAKTSIPSRKIKYSYDIASYYPHIHNNYHTFYILEDDGIMYAQIIVIDIVTEKIYECHEDGSIYNI